MIQDPQSALQKLALVLVTNHIRLSVPPDLHADAHKLLSTSPPNVGTSSAVVVVVGAGASHDAVGLPLGEDAAVKLQATLRVPSDYLDRELHRLSIQYRLDTQEFETRLLALSRFGESPLLDALSALFGRRFYCTQTYEILAHLFKHRFVDAIINFNFDELLDQAIEDEVGRQNCWMIASDGDLPLGMWDRHQRLRLPLYVKPHGTSSHRSSMRFTREAYFLLPEAIGNLLLACLTGTDHVTILTLGFGMRSVEFADIVRRAAKTTAIEVMALDTDENVLARFPSEIAPERKSLLHPMNSGGIGSLLDALWQTVETTVKDSSLLRGIERHQLLSTLFTDRPNLDTLERDRGSDLINYLSDRVVVELALVAAKAKGFVTIGQLEGSRVWQYLRHYLETTGAGRESIYAFGARLGLRQTGYSRDAMRLEVPGSDLQQPTGLIIAPHDWPAAREALCERVVEALSPRRKEIAQTPNGMHELDATIQRMYSGKEVEVYSPRDSRYEMMFTAPQEFRSLMGVQVYTNRLLAGNWERLFCVAESGEWLLDESVRAVFRKKPGRRIAIIVAFEAYKKELISRYGEDNVRVCVFELPWWLHNQHMTIAVRGRVPVQAVYFERRQRSLSINPVGLDEYQHRSDLEALLDSYCAYWVKAKRFRMGKGADYVSDIDIRQAREELLLGEAAWDV